jgi:hypothetical protein
MTHHGRHAEGAFPVSVLPAAEQCRRRVRPGELIGAVVRRVDDDGVVGNAEIVQRLEQFAYVPSSSVPEEISGYDELLNSAGSVENSECAGVPK